MRSPVQIWLSAPRRNPVISTITGFLLFCRSYRHIKTHTKTHTGPKYKPGSSALPGIFYCPLEQYDAVVVAVGACHARTLNLAGAKTVERGILPAVAFLTDATKTVLAGRYPALVQGRDGVVVGGGDTGSDCVGTALRQGCRSVTQVEMLPAKTGCQIPFEGHPSRGKEQKHDFSQEECAQVFGHPHL